MKTALLLIDFQNDFCIGPKEQTLLGLPNCGTLSVDGAYEDCTRVAKFIVDNGKDITKIVLTQDTHHVMDISHPTFWRKADGTMPDPFTSISSADIAEGKYYATVFPLDAIEYVKKLEADGEFPHLLWPIHCINGSWGAAIVDVVMDAVMQWCASYRKVHTIVQKGEYPLTEHFGALRANVPNLSIPSTNVNQGLINTLLSMDKVYLAGEAKSHCVANTLKQLMNEAPMLVSKLVVLENCMSNVGGAAWPAADVIYTEAKSKGVKFENI